MDVGEAEELYSAYGGTTPRSKGTTTNKRQLTPENAGPLKRFTGPNRSPGVPFSPASFSPASATPSKKYNSRTNKGEVMVNFGSTQNMKWEGSGQEVKIEHYSPVHALTKSFKYMFQKLSEKFRVLDDMIEDMAEQLKKAHDIEEFSHVALPTQEEVTVVGRICCDSNGKLNAKSVLLEGSVDMSAGKTIPVDLTQLKEYALFPGQIVAFEGNNSTGQKFIAKKIYECKSLPLPEVTKNSNPGSTRLSVLVAAGPFSTSDSLSYEPLTDLVQQIQQTKPDVCILMGPFVDCKNGEIEGGKLTITYEELFKGHMERIASATQSLQCQVVILPSQRDIHHDCVYPQMPFKIDNFHYSHVHFMPDPCMLSINGIVFGVTSTDVLFQLGSEEIAYPPGSSNRFERLSQHLLTQQSFYPLYPCNEELSVDYEQFEKFATMTTTPHVMIIPSDFKQFIKDIQGCCCVNPGRLTKGLTGSTFAKILIQVNNLQSNQSVVSNVTAQVVRI